MKDDVRSSIYSAQWRYQKTKLKIEAIHTSICLFLLTALHLCIFFFFFFEPSVNLLPRIPHRAKALGAIRIAARPEVANRPFTSPSHHPPPSRTSMSQTRRVRRKRKHLKFFLLLLHCAISDLAPLLFSTAVLQKGRKLYCASCLIFNVPRQSWGTNTRFHPPSPKGVGRNGGTFFSCLLASSGGKGSHWTYLL